MHQIASAKTHLTSRMDLATERTYVIGVLLGFVVTACEVLITVAAIDGFISGRYVLLQVLAYGTAASMAVVAPLVSRQLRPWLLFLGLVPGSLLALFYTFVWFYPVHAVVMVVIWVGFLISLSRTVGGPGRVERA